MMSSGARTEKAGKHSQRLPGISVAMATFNGAKHLQEQLDSLCRQTLLPQELVVTDDGSTDDTVALLERFREQAPFPVHVHRNPVNLGYAENFFRACSLCTGELIALCDQDDVWLEAKLQTCAGYFRDPEITLVIHAAETWDGTKGTGRFHPAFAKTRILPQATANFFTLVPGFAMVFRKEILSVISNANRPGDVWSLGKPEHQMAHDGWVWLLATTTGKVATLSDVLALYRQHGGNFVGAPTEWGMGKSVRVARGTVNYTLLAELEERYGAVLREIADKLPAQRRGPTLRLAHRLTLRGRMHRYRAEIYAEGAGLWQRLRSFAAIVLMGGYLPDPRRVRMGPKALVKDLAIGVPGRHR